MGQRNGSENTVLAHFIVKNAADALDFYSRAFGAEELFRLVDPDGRIGHAEIRIGHTLLMLADEHPDFGAVSPPSLGGTTVSFHIVVSDAEQAVGRALEEGATLIRPIQEQFYGARSGMVADPFGYRWFIAHPTEEVAPDEMQRRYTSLLQGQPS
jgi:PhnB protein